jgi:nucleoid DNA-binding protein
MLPKNSKHYIVPTAEELQFEVTLVEDVISFYYSSLRKSLVDLECYQIQVENFGTFKVKGKELPKLYNKYKKHLEVLNPETFHQMQLKKIIESKLEKIIKVQDLLESERKRKQQFLENKYGNTRKNMES